MTGPRDREPVPELTTTRVGGGRSAKLIALAAVVALVAVVYVGVSGRPNESPAPTLQGNAPVISEAPSQDAAALNTIQQIRDPAAPPQYQYLGTALVIGGQEFIASLDQESPTDFYGAYRIPFKWSTDRGTLELAQMTSTVSHDTFDHIGVWVLSLAVDNPSTSLGGVVLDAVQEPTPRVVVTSRASRIIRNGYRVTARLERQSDFDVLAIQVHVGRDPLLPDESYSLDVHAGQSSFSSALQVLEPEHLTGQVVIPNQIPASPLLLELDAIPMADPLLGRVAVGSWTMALEAPKDFLVGEKVLDVTVPPGVVRPGEAQIVGNGFTLTADNNALEGGRTIVFDLTIRPLTDPTLSE